MRNVLKNNLNGFEGGVLNRKRIYFLSEVLQGSLCVLFAVASSSGHNQKYLTSGNDVSNASIID